MKKIFFAFAACVIILTGCDKGGEDIVGKQIELPNASEATQTAFADDQTTGSFTFVAKSAWTAEVTETTPRATITQGSSISGRASNPSTTWSSPTTYSSSETRASSGVDWLKLLLNGIETYQGASGTITLTIELTPNFTGENRNASINIMCGDEKIVIDVTQKREAEDGTIPSANDKNGLLSKIISKGTSSTGPWEDVISFIYDDQDRVIGINAHYTESVYGTVYVAEYARIYTYEEGAILYYYNGDYNREATAYMGDDGFVANITSAYPTKSYTLTYKDGYLQKNRVKTEIGYESFNMIWEDGNIVRIENDEITEYGQQIGEFNVFAATYGKDINNTNIDMNSIICNVLETGPQGIMDMDNGDVFFMTALGLCGKRSVNLITEVIEIFNYDPTPDKYTFEWQINEAGYPESVLVTRYQPESAPDSRTCTFVYTSEEE